MSKAKTTKGKIQAYDQWTPEYTKTGKLTARSQKALDAIRQGAMGEHVLSSDLTDFVDIAAFTGLSTAFYYGINPVLYEILAALANLPKVITGIFDYNVTFLSDIKGTTTTGMLKIAAASKADADALGNQVVGEVQVEKRRSILRKRAQVEVWERSLVDLRTLLVGVEETGMGGPSKRDEILDAIQTLEKAIDEAETAISKLEAEIAAGAISPDDAVKIEWKLEAIKVGVAMGQAGGWMWFLKSYSFSKAVENITITG